MLASSVPMSFGPSGLDADVELPKYIKAGEWTSCILNIEPTCQLLRRRSLYTAHPYKLKQSSGYLRVVQVLGGGSRDQCNVHQRWEEWSLG